MWQLTGEIISLAGSEYARGASHGELDPAADHDAGLLTPVRQHLLARGGTSGVALVQHRELPRVALCGHQAQRDFVSRVKNSASGMCMPSRTFFSELTDGLTRFCSIREMSPLVTPARRASSRWDRPKVVRTLRSRAPTSMLMVFRILDNKGKNIAPVAVFVHFIYHSALLMFNRARPRTEFSHAEFQSVFAASGA